MRRSAPPDVTAIAERHLLAGDPTGWFEPVYRAAGRRRHQVPWASHAPHPYLLDWLDEPPAAAPGPRAVVVGCGYGDDAAELARRGLEVVAFDVAPSALDRAGRRFRRAGVTWREADLLALPDDLVGGFDLVVEVHTVGYLPGVVRDAAMQAVASLAAPGGVVVAVTWLAASARGAEGADGPPWPQAPAELAAYRAGGLEQVALEHPAPDERGRMEARLTWRRPASG